MNAPLSSEDKAIHFGPVYGRRAGQSMALCDSVLPPAGTSRTMSRSLKMITCDKCDQAIQEMVNENPPVRREDIT
jgi:hypothetical protein